MATDNEARVLPAPLARLSYPATHRPRVNTLRPNDPPQYGGTLIFDIPAILADEKEKAKLAAMLTMAQQLMKQRFPTETWEGPFMDRTSGCHSPWLDGNLPKYRDKDGLGEGKRFIRTSSNRIIPCVDRNRTPITDPEALYPGCYVYAFVAPFIYDPRKVRPEATYGVGFGLRALQFVKDGQRLDDSIDATQAFEALDGDNQVSGDLAGIEGLFGLGKAA